MNSERGKIILVAVLLVGAVGMYWFWGRPAEPLSDTVAFVCVATGEIVRFDRDDIPSLLPARNEETGQRTMLPCGQDGDKYFVSSRYRSMLRDPEKLGKVNKYVDPRTLEVLDTPRN